MFCRRAEGQQLRVAWGGGSDSLSLSRDTSFIVLAPRYVVLHHRGEIRRSPYSRQDTSLLILAPRYVVLCPRAEIRCSSSTRRDTSFFVLAPRYVVLCPRVAIHELIKPLRTKQNLSQILSLNKEWQGMWSEWGADEERGGAGAAEGEWKWSGGGAA